MFQKCKPGYEYEEATLESKECCGKCIQIACVVGDVVHEVGEEWTSPDYCTNYYCLNLNGSVSTKTTKTTL